MSDTSAGTTSSESPARPVAPVRTRWLESRPADTSGGVLPPTRSSGTPFRRPARPAPVEEREEEPESVASVAPEAPAPPSQAAIPSQAPEIEAETTSEPAGDEAMPWDAPPAAQTSGGVTDDLRAGEVDAADEPWAETLAAAPPDQAAGEPVAPEESDVAAEGRPEVEIEAWIEIDEDAPEEDLDLELVPVDEADLAVEEAPLETRFYEELPEGAVPVPAPLSAWDFSDAEEAGADPSASRVARGRAEWEALGEALAASLGGEDPSVFESAMQALAEGIASSEPGDAELGVTREIVDIADRIAYFASQMRSEGYRAITRAQARGDRLEIALAGLAAGFLAGQHE